MQIPKICTFFGFFKEHIVELSLGPAGEVHGCACNVILVFVVNAGPIYYSHARSSSDTSSLVVVAVQSSKAGGDSD